MNFELRLLKKKRKRIRLFRNEKEHSRFSPFSIAKKVFSRCFPLISPSSHPSTAPASRPFLLRSPYPACLLFSWVRPTFVLLNFQLQVLISEHYGARSFSLDPFVNNKYVLLCEQNMTLYLALEQPKRGFFTF